MSKVEFLAKRLDKLVTPDGQLFKLVQFTHDSPSLQKVRLGIAEAILHTLEQYEGE